MNSFGGFVNENSGDPFQSQAEFKDPNSAVGNPNNVFAVMNNFSFPNQVLPNVHFPRLQHQHQHPTACEQGLMSSSMSGTAADASSGLWCPPYQDQSSHIPHGHGHSNHNPSLGNCETAMMNQNQNPVQNHRLPHSHSLDTPYSGSLIPNSSYQQDMRGYNSATGGAGLDVEVESLQPTPAEIFHYPDASGCAGLGWTEAYNSQWQLMGGGELDSWGLPLPLPPPTSTTYPLPLPSAPIHFSFSNANKLKSAIKLPTNTNSSSCKSSYPIANINANVSTTTNEDYQQDVLIQQEFQRLDEMLLRDDDDDLSCLSDVDQVSVESVVSSEQQYDSPWEPPGPEQQNQITVTKEESVSGQISTAAQQTEFTIATATATATVTSCPAPDQSQSHGHVHGQSQGPGRSSSHILTNTRSSTLSSRVAAVVEEFRENCEQLMMHSSQCVEENNRNIPLPHASSQTVGTTTVRTISTTVQAIEPVAVNLKKLTFRPKSLATTSTSYDTHRVIPAQGGDCQHSYLEQKRTLERVRIEEVRLTDRPATLQGYPSCPTEMVGGSSPADFGQGSLSTRLATPRIPRIRMEPLKRSPVHQQSLNNIRNAPAQSTSPSQTQIQTQGQVQNQNVPNPFQRSSLRRKPSTLASTPVPPEMVAPSNMMGISHGDGVWGAIPEMNARMYLPHGVLHFKMEYQPTGSRNLSFPTQLPRSHQQQQQQQQQQQHQLDLSSNLAKFTHPIIHMLPLSSDGSTRLNVTFDVLYQN